jgi:hypothetical protein
VSNYTEKAYESTSSSASTRTHGGHPTLGKFSCAAPQLAAFSSQVFITQYHSPPLHLSMMLLASIDRSSILHLPQAGLQQRIHSYGSLAVMDNSAAAARFFELR